LLCARSEFFRKSFQKDFREGQEDELYLPEDDSDAFANTIDWIFSQRLACHRKHTTSDADQAEHQMRFRKLFVLADKFLLRDLANDTAIEYEKCLTKGSWLPSIEAVGYIYENTIEKSAIRKVMVRLYVEWLFRKESKNADDWAGTIISQPNFCKDVLEAVNAHIDLDPSRCNIKIKCRIHSDE